MKTICILNYGAGNVKSVKNAFDRVGIDSQVSNEISAIKRASHIVLPGVGAFGAAMQRIQESIPLSELRQEVLNRSKPFLGICVGLQVLAEWGYEHGKYQGLGWLNGAEVRENTKEVQQPHIGWNSVSIERNSPIFKDIESETDFYFVHSYVLKSVESDHVVGTTKYGIEFPSVIQNQNIFGVQFHPEKSQRAGLKLIHNFTLVE